ncbi:hypothetical protein [uncultured Xanthomonas sp.]|uniref:hypothetical protein n=1 Tax=uncultured Xanthomonas sp. TaxID=152831 RepID=UPI0025E70AED|nr:hypothetical protein [uncultured Xanthomonas sp.]
MSIAVNLRDLTPPEVSAAAETLAAARRDALPTKAAKRSRTVFYALTLISGGAIGHLLLQVGLIDPKDKDLWRAVLTATSVLSGFMIATMLFTGKIDVAKSLSISELRDVSLKANYLLLYQFGTLINHFTCLVMALLVPAIVSRWEQAGQPAAILICGLFFASLIRSTLIPLQIIELHRFTHAALLREKRDEVAKLPPI